MRDLIHLGFLIERRYAPYSKWFGTAFSRLPCAAVLTPVFDQVLSATSWTDRERFLAQAYEYVAGLHNDLDITAPLETAVSPFYGRPFQVIHADRFVSAILAKIQDPVLRRLGTYGGVDQITDNTDVRSHPSAYRRLAPLYEDGS